MVLLKEIISNSIEEIMGSYIAYAASDSSTRLGKIDKDDLAQFVKTANKVTNGDLESLTNLLDLTRILFPNVISGEKRIQLLNAIKIDLFDKGISLESEFLDEDNIDDCISYYTDVFKYENRIFMQLTTAIQEKIIRPYVNTSEGAKVPQIIGTFIDTLFNDYTVDRLIGMVEFIANNGGGATLEEYNSLRAEGVSKIHDLAESIALGKLDVKHVKMITESIEDVVSSAWTFVKEFNKIKEEGEGKEFETKLSKTVSNHLSVVVEALSNKEDLSVEDILRGLNVLIPLSSILSSFDKTEDVDGDYKEAFNRLAKKINAVDLGEKKESVDGMISVIGSNINKFLR